MSVLRLMVGASVPDRLGDVDKGRLQRAVASGLKKTARGGRNIISRGVKNRYSYKKGVSRYITTAMQGATSVEIRVKDSRHSIKDYSYSKPGKKSYLRGEVVKGRSGLMRRAFLLRGQPMTRVGRARYPIRRVMGPSVAEMAGHYAEPATYIEGQLGERLEREMQSAVRGLLGGFL